MPVVSTLGAMSSRGFGEFSQQVSGAYVEDYFSTNLYTGTGAAQTINTLTNGFTQTAAWSSWTLKKTGSDSRAYDVVTDSSNNFYAVGAGSSFPGNGIVFAKYNSAGTLQWQKILEQNDSRGISIDVDSSGNVYVMGRANNGSVDYCAIAKYNSSGTLQWQRKLTESTYDTDFGQIKSDSSGNVYIATRIGAGYGIVAKYNSSGTIQWQKKINASMGASAFGIAVDSSGNVFVSGQLGAGTAFLMKMDSSGSSVWQKEFNSNFGSNGAAFYRLAIDSSGNLYTTGTEYGGISIVKFDSSGNITWNRKLNGGAGYSINVDSSGNVAVTGYDGSPTYIVVALYNSTGTLQWQRKLTVLSTNTSNGRGVAFDGLGNLYVASLAEDTSNVYFSVAKLKASGSTVAGLAFLTMSNGTLTDSAGTLASTSVSYSFGSGTATDAAGTATDSTYDAVSTQYNQNAVNASGGMVWIKGRSGATDHALYDTARGATFDLVSNSNAAQTTQTQGVTAFGASSFDIGTLAKLNTNAAIYVAWAFSKAPKFFDVFTYTGDGSTDRTINHSLDSTPAMIFVKCTSENTRNWMVYHRGLNGGGAFAYEYALSLNAINGEFVSSVWKRQPTSTSFFVTSEPEVNGNGKSYVAYLFAHDAGGFGADGSQNVISCGSYTGTVNDFESVNLGYEPQCLLIKKVNTTGNWFLIDNMRGFNVFNTGTGSARYLYPNLTNVETGVDGARVNSTGFSFYFGSGETYIYMAIRRGPMATPTDATKVFMPTVYTGTNVDNRLVNTTIAPDTVWMRQRNSTTVGGMVVGDRLRGQPYLLTGTTAAEVNDADSFDQQLISAVEYGTAFSSMNGVWVGNDVTSQLNASTTASNQIAEAFKRAPGFFDIVYYNFNSYGATPTTVDHNLNVVPELIISKQVNGSDNWYLYHASLGANKSLSLNTSSAVTTAGGVYIDNLTKTTFRAMWYQNINGNSITYLFATCPGVSKVGSYTGTGTTLQINCGFTAGARFVLIKRTDTTGDWYVYDSARGIVAGNDPYLLLNSTAAEVTNTDYVDTYSAGFELSSTAPADLNANGGTYIFLAIA